MTDKPTAAALEAAEKWLRRSHDKIPIVEWYELATRFDAFAAQPSAPPKEAYGQPADTVERVARAIHAAAGYNQGRWELSKFQQMWRRYAQAAITAMTEER